MSTARATRPDRVRRGDVGIGVRAAVHARLAAALAAGLVLGAGRVLSAPAAQPTSHAGLVILLAGGDVRTFCVAFAEPSITGETLLRRSGLDIAAEVGMLGTTVCQIDETGCAYPREACLCRCRSLGAGCTYWAYHTLDGDRWSYSILGAAARVVRDGDVDGWAWGQGSVVAGAAPPVRTFDQLCGVGDDAPTPAPPSMPTAAPATARPAAIDPATPAPVRSTSAATAPHASAPGPRPPTPAPGQSAESAPPGGDSGGTETVAAAPVAPAGAGRSEDASVGAATTGRSIALGSASTGAGAGRAAAGRPAADDAPSGSGRAEGANGDRAAPAGPSDRLAFAVYAAFVVALAGAAVWLRRGR